MKQTGLFLLGNGVLDLIYSPDEQRRATERLAFPHPPQTPDSIGGAKECLADVEVILSGWGMPPVDDDFLAAAPKLKAIFYGAGSVKGFVTDALWKREIIVTSSYAANAVPVSEFTCAQIVLALKRAWPCALDIKRKGNYGTKRDCAGAYGSTIGLVSMGMIGRMVRERLRTLDVRVIAFDPFLSAAAAAALEVELCPLDEIFHRADVVSLHTPWLKETEGMIRGAHFAGMKPDATFINTARGAIVHEAEMIEALRLRPDLTALLDVTHPEPPVPGSPLYTLPNVVLTPHIAGSLNGECRRMGRDALDELERYLAGQPLRWRITREKAAIMA